MIILEVNYISMVQEKTEFHAIGYIFDDVCFELSNNGQTEVFTTEFDLVSDSEFPCKLIHTDETIHKELRRFLL